jgi:excisionase family DNA binding protein
MNGVRDRIELEELGNAELNLGFDVERQPRTRQVEAELLRVTEAAEFLALSRTKVYEMAERGEIPAVKIGTAVRIPRRRLLEWIEAQTTGGGDLTGKR